MSSRAGQSRWTRVGHVSALGRSMALTKLRRIPVSSGSTVQLESGAVRGNMSQKAIVGVTS